MSTLSYRVAELVPSELNWLLSTFKRSYRESCADVRTDQYFAAQGAICDALLARFPTILVARNPDGVALGWICCESTPTAIVVHFAYTKASYRRSGIFTALLGAANDRLADSGDGLVYTHKTRRTHILDRLGFSYLPVGRFLRENA
jgi:GNAT superfamily N-acetyltransferase